MGGKTTDTYTAAGQQMLKSIAKLEKKPYVKVGFPVDAFNKKKKRDQSNKISSAKLVRSLLRDMGADIAAENEPYTLGEVAVANEFGTDTIPARSFIGSTHDREQKRWWEVTKALKIKVLLLTVSIPKALGLLGEIIKKDIQATIRKGGEPYVPNAPSTIAKKGSTNPLIDTGQMVNGVTYERVNAD